MSTTTRAALAALALASVATLSACGGQSETTAPTSSTTSTAPATVVTTPTPAPEPLTAAQLTSALLKVADLPTGWSVQSEWVPNSTAKPICGVMAFPTKVAQVGRNYVKGTGFSTNRLTLNLTSFPDEATAKSAMEKSHVSWAACTKWTFENGTTATFREEAPPQLAEGDQTFSIREEYKSNGIGWHGVMHTTRIGSVIVRSYGEGIMDTPADTGAFLTSQMAKVALAAQSAQVA